MAGAHGEDGGSGADVDGGYLSRKEDVGAGCLSRREVWVPAAEREGLARYPRRGGDSDRIARGFYRVGTGEAAPGDGMDIC